MKRLFGLITALSLLSMRPADAAMVQRVSASQAQGLTGNGVSILLRAGSGTNIDFTQTGEAIQKVWFDDPGFATFDADTPLCQQGSQCTQEGGASIIHLRRIDGIRFPNLPASTTTMMTVITNSSDGKKTYIFPIAYGAGAASYMIEPDSHSLGGNGLLMNDGRTASWSDIERGVQAAIQQDLLPADSPVVIRTYQFLSQVRNGRPIEQAISRSGISMEIILHLAQMGYRTIAVPAAEPGGIAQ